VSPDSAAQAPTVDIVEQFATALSSGDFGTARSLLANDLHFACPIDEFHCADDYLGALRQLFGMVRGIEHQATVAKDAQVVRFSVLDTPVAKAPVAEWYTVKDGRIAEVRAYFDARPFAPAG
jgi:limonene-1,2-epoxide hydrolase